MAEADTLVADLRQRLAAGFSQERERLESQWDRGDDVSTEDRRVALTATAFSSTGFSLPERDKKVRANAVPFSRTFAI